MSMVRHLVYMWLYAEGVFVFAAPDGRFVAGSRRGSREQTLNEVNEKGMKFVRLILATLERSRFFLEGATPKQTFVASKRDVDASWLYVDALGRAVASGNADYVIGTVEMAIDDFLCGADERVVHVGMFCEASVVGPGELRDPWLRRKFPAMGEPLDVLGRLNNELDTAHRPIIERFVAFLATLEGRNFGSLEANQRVAQMIQETANRLDITFRCPKCWKPARLKCVKTGGADTGVFSFAHGSKSTHAGGSKLPILKPFKATL